jgi:tight adherence protein C
LTICSALLGFILHFDSTELAASVALGVLVGANIPKIWVMHKINKRREEIRRAIPNVLDLMVVCAEAGLSFTAAIQRIVKENRTSRNPLYEELQLLTQEFLIGGSKADAFRNLANRTGVEEIRSLAITLIQAEKLGTSIAESLRVLADSMRFKRRQRAEEQANKTSVKLVFPLVLLIFPELLVILVGPALIIMYNTLSQVAQ